MGGILSSLLNGHYALMNTFLLFLSRVLYRKLSTHSPIKKILIFRKGTIGDSICAMPAVVAIRKRFPQAELHCLTNAPGTVQSGMPDFFDAAYIQNYLYFTAPNRALFSQIKSEHYDMVIELPQALDTWYTQLRNLILFRLAGIRFGAGWQVSTTFLFKHAQMKYLRFDREPVRLLRLLQEYKVLTDASEEYILPLTDAAIALATDQPFVLMGVGAKPPRNRWPVQHYHDIALRIVAQHHIQVLLLGHQGDYELTKDWNIKGVLNLCGQLSIQQSYALAGKCLFYVGNDTGLMHMAAAHNKPVVGIFSGKNYPGKWFPASHEQYIHANYTLPCAICAVEPCENNVCMKQILPDAVWPSVQQLLQRYAS